MRRLDKRLATLGLIIILGGAGAAVGPVLARQLAGRTTVTATQALNLQLPLVDGADIPILARTVIGGGTLPGFTLAQQLPPKARIYQSLNDTSLQFTVAVDLVATSGKFDVVVPIGNLSNNQVIAQLQLHVPEGLDVDVVTSGPVDVLTTAPATVTPIAGKATFTRLNANTWEGTWQPATATYEEEIQDSFPPLTIVAYNGFVMHVALHNGTPPGFYVIQGTLVPRNV